MLILPEAIRTIVGDRSFAMDAVGKSDSQVVCFDDMVLKIEKQGEESDSERLMMRWLDGKLPVPKALCYEQIDDTNYLLMSRVKGQMLCSPGFLDNPKQLCGLLAKGLKMLWSVDISDCPYHNGVENKLRLAETRVAGNLCSTEDVEPGIYGADGFKSPAELLAWLKDNKPMENPTFSHGDYCLPNILAQNGDVTGFIDLGRSGTADKYQDIALCYRSLRQNFSGKHTGIERKELWTDAFFEELGIEPDWDLIQYYVLLDELF